MPYQSSKCIPTCLFDVGYHAYNLSSLRNIVYSFLSIFYVSIIQLFIFL